jgi:hypothetical protein
VAVEAVHRGAIRARRRRPAAAASGCQAAGRLVRGPEAAQLDVLEQHRHLAERLRDLVSVSVLDRDGSSCRWSPRDAALPRRGPSATHDPRRATRRSTDGRPASAD